MSLALQPLLPRWPHLLEPGGREGKGGGHTPRHPARQADDGEIQQLRDRVSRHCDMGAIAKDWNFRIIFTRRNLKLSSKQAHTLCCGDSVWFRSTDPSFSWPIGLGVPPKGRAGRARVAEVDPGEGGDGGSTTNSWYFKELNIFPSKWH